MTQLGEAPSLGRLGFKAIDVEATVDGVLSSCSSNNPVALEREGLVALLDRAMKGHRPAPRPCSTSDLVSGLVRTEVISLLSKRKHAAS